MYTQIKVYDKCDKNFLYKFILSRWINRLTWVRPKEKKKKGNKTTIVGFLINGSGLSKKA